MVQWFSGTSKSWEVVGVRVLCGGLGLWVLGFGVGLVFVSSWFVVFGFRNFKVAASGLALNRSPIPECKTANPPKRQQPNSETLNSKSNPRNPDRENVTPRLNPIALHPDSTRSPKNRISNYTPKSKTPDVKTPIQQISKPKA